MAEFDVERFIEEIKTTMLRDFAPPAESSRSSPLSKKIKKYDVSRTDIPVPELVRFILGFILQFRIHGPEEKVRWTIPFVYKGNPCAFSLQKFGLRLFIEYDEERLIDINGIALEIIKKIQKSIYKAEKNYLIPFAERQLEKRQLTILNRYHIMINRYFYFREKAEEVAEKNENYQAKGVEGLAKVLNKMVHMKNELFYNAIAMLDSYFSSLEHLFVLIMPLSRSDLPLVDFISSSWTEKCKLLFDLNSDPEAKKHFDKLHDIKEKFRNFWAHGAFEKKGTSLFIHIPNVGALPVQFSEVKNNPHFDFFPVKESNFKGICKIIDDFERWLRTEKSGLSRAIMYIESGLDVPCDQKSIAEIREAMKSEEKLENLIKGKSYLWEKHANMDY
jgi:hypothetical protein